MRLAVALVLALCGCRQILGFDSPTTPPAGDDAPVDTNLPPPDGGLCTELATSCVTPDTLRTCGAIGEMSFDTSCGLGCAITPTAHCGKLQPAGGGVVPEDLDTAATLSDVTLGAATFNGSTGTINNSSAGVDFHVANNIAIFRFRSLTLDGAITLAGTHPIALVVAQDIIINGTIDARGTCNANTAGPGGGLGGDMGLNGTGPAASGGTGGANDSGGGGGANGGHGGNAGTNGATAPVGGSPFGDDAITVLVGGSGGGGGTQQQTETGGGGGGAIQLVAGFSITITDTGGINAGGCGGEGNNCPNCDYAGGGAGGTILIESRQVTLMGSLAVNGGGGGGAGGDGEDASLSRIGAAGGPMSNGGNGGSGAAGANAAGAPGIDHPSRAGGGGGGIGRIRVNTSHDSGLTADNTHLSPAFDDPATTCTRGAVGVQ